MISPPAGNARDVARKRAMLGRVGLALLLGCAAWIPAAQAQDELARLAAPDSGERAGYSDFAPDEPVGRFMDLLTAGAIQRARSLLPQACAAWTRGRGGSAWSGRVWINGVELSLDQLCHTAPPAGH